MANASGHCCELPTAVDGQASRTARVPSVETMARRSQTARRALAKPPRPIGFLQIGSLVAQKECESKHHKTQFSEMRVAIATNQITEYQVRHLKIETFPLSKLKRFSYRNVED